MGDTIDLTQIPGDAVGLRLCKMRGDELVLCEPVLFEKGRAAVHTTLRRAQICGRIGPIGETGDFWADFLNESGDWSETIALSRDAWNSLKNRWMRCKMDSAGRKK